MSVSFDFSGKYVLVTGSTKGIGYQIADDYAKAGANVLISGRKKEDVNKVISDLAAKHKIDLKKDGKRLIACVGDCGTKEGCDILIETIKKECPNGHIDVLVNNVGIFQVIPFDQVTDDTWLEYFNVNIMSGVRLSRYCISKMLEPCDAANDEKSNEKNGNANANGAPKIDLTDKNVKRKGGNIVFISSEAGMRVIPAMIHYSMTKTAQIAIARGLAHMCQGIPNVRVNSLCPGPTDTEGVDTFLRGLPENQGKGDKLDIKQAKKDYFAMREPNSIKQDFLSTKEISDACLYLTSDAASGTTGAAMRVDGGLVYHI